MSIPRIYVSGPLAAGAVVDLPEDASRHVVQVLRMRPGDPLIVFNGTGGEYAAALLAVRQRAASAQLKEFRNINRESPIPVTLVQAVSKSERMDYAIQKAVELGAAEIVPVITERCVVQLSTERWERKLEHWQGIVTAACEQSGRTRMPALRPVGQLLEWLPRSEKSAMKLVLAPASDSLLPPAKPVPPAVMLLVGPEGGLSDVEVRFAELNGFRALGLGPRILRTETAGVAALAVVQALWGDFGTR